MSSLKKIIIAIFLVFSTSACATVYVPCRKSLKNIQAEPYDFITNDCVIKSYKQSIELKKAGIVYRIVLGIDTNIIPNYNIPNYNPHIWIECFNKKTKTWHLMDPTWWKETQGFEISLYPQKQRWAIYKTSATAEDIEKMKEFTAIFWNNLPKAWHFYFKKITRLEKKISL